MTQSYDKSPYNHSKIQQTQRYNTYTKRHKNFDYTTIALDRLRQVTWRNNNWRV